MLRLLPSVIIRVIVFAILLCVFYLPCISYAAFTPFLLFYRLHLFLKNFRLHHKRWMPANTILLGHQEIPLLYVVRHGYLFGNPGFFLFQHSASACSEHWLPQDLPELLQLKAYGSVAYLHCPHQMYVMTVFLMSMPCSVYIIVDCWP